MNSFPVIEIAIALGLLVGLGLAAEVGFRLGRRAQRGGKVLEGQVGAVQGAVLGLLALLLGFSFAGAAGRFIQRQDLITQEANAIGTAYLRADLLDTEPRMRLRDTLRDYVADRVATGGAHQVDRDPALAARVATAHAGIWDAALSGVLRRPGVAVAVLDPVNEVIDLHSTRVAASRRHLPHLVLALLIVSSLLGTSLVGYGLGSAGRRSAGLMAVLVALLWISLWTTIDLDYPRAGLLQLDDRPLVELRASMGEEGEERPGTP